MRKLLLATTATLSGFIGMAGIAHAQLKLNDGTPYTSSFTPGGGQGVQQPAPGNIVFHFNGRFAFSASDFMDQNFNVSYAAQAAGNPAGPEKVGNIGFTDNVRLYPGFDGVAANGLRYGAYLELRNDSTKSTNIYTGNLSTTTPNSNTLGVLNGGATTTPDVGARTNTLFYTYQSWGYINSPDLGTVRMGMMFPSNAMFLTGTVENFNDGGWHGTQGVSMLGGFPWPFVDNGIGMGYLGVQYLSPQIYGFDFSATYQPDAGDNQWSGCSLAAAGPGCDRLVSTTDPNSYARRTNWVDASVRYRGAFGPVGVAANVGGIYAGAMHNSLGGIGVAGSNSTLFNTYHNVEEFLAGAQVTFGGLLVGGHIETGQGIFQQQLESIAGKNITTWTAGATYTIGAFTAGVQYQNLHDSHAVTAATVHGYTGQGPYVGAQYVVAPGLLTYIGYAYSDVKQTGKNLITGANTATTSVGAYTTNNHIHDSYATIGTVFSW